MLKRLLLLKNLSFHWYQCLVALAFVAITAVALFQPHHWRYNLEPYPDGLLYALSGLNLWQRGYLGLEYQGTRLSYAIAPLYTLSLIPLELVLPIPTAIIISNILWGVAGLLLLSGIVYKLTGQKISGLYAGAGYVLHSDTLWLVNVPMAENASLTITIGALGLLLLAPPSLLWTLVTLIAIGLLVATKFSLLTLSLGLSVSLLIKLMIAKKYRQIITLLGVSLLGLVGLLLTKILVPTGFLAFWQDLTLKHVYYSATFIFPNLKAYFISLIGLQGHILWLKNPLSSLGILVTAVGGGVVLFKRHQLSRLTTLSFGLFAPLILLSIFYSNDDRYFISAIPCLVILSSIAFTSLYKVAHDHPQKLLLGAGALAVLFLQLLAQRSALKEIIVSNFLGRTEAWQYQSIRHFNDYFQSHPQAQVITALPPYLVTIYQTGDYRVLPLSTSQEFMQKGQYIWGSGITYSDLIAGYQSELQGEQPLYISNAYITQLPQVIADYELYKQDFNVTLVSRGCEEACNIYQITAKSR